MEREVTSKLDAIDKRILAALQRNSKLSYRKLAKELLLPITTLHHRIRKLEQSGVIRRYTVELDHKKLDQRISAYILLKVDFAGLKEKNMTKQILGCRLKSLPNVEDVAIITGLKDILVKTRVAGIAELNQLLAKHIQLMPGIKSTETLIVLDDLEEVETLSRRILSPQLIDSSVG